MQRLRKHGRPSPPIDPVAAGSGSRRHRRAAGRQRTAAIKAHQSSGPPATSVTVQVVLRPA